MMMVSAAIAGIAIWLLLLYREFGITQARQRKAEAAKRQKFTRAQPADAENIRVKPRRKARAFGNR